MTAQHTLVGLIVQGGTQGATLRPDERIRWGMSDDTSLQQGAYNPQTQNFMQRFNSAAASAPSNLQGNPDLWRYQVASDLLLKGAGSFYSATGDLKAQSRQAADWFAARVADLRQQGIATNEIQTQDLISMMMEQMYSNYNDPLNPGVPGGDNKPRNLATMGAGYQQYLEGTGQTNDQGGVCDHIAATGCQLWNKLYPGKPCYIVNIPGPGLQHWYTAIGNADGTYTLMDAGWRQKMTAEGNAISAPGNPQLFVPIARVNDAGDATIVATPPSELMNFVRSIARPDTEEGQLFRGMSQAGYTTFTAKAKKDRFPTVITVGAGRGRLSQQNMGEQVWGVFANIDKTKRHVENKLTVFYTMVQGTPDGTYHVVGVDNTTSVFYAIPIAKDVKIDLRAGGNIAGGAMINEWGVGVNAGLKVFGQAGVSGRRQLGPNTTLSGNVIFRAEGMPGLVITQMHGIDGFGDLFNGGMKNGFNGFPVTLRNQNQLVLEQKTPGGTHAFGLQGGVQSGPLNYDGRPDWNLGGNYSFNNGRTQGFTGMNAGVSVNDYNTIFNDGTVAKASVGGTFAASSRNSRNVTLFTPSLSTQLSNYGGQTQFFMGGGLLINFGRKPARTPTPP